VCGRYALHNLPEVVALQFGLTELPAFEARYNIAPSSNVLVISSQQDGQPLATTMRWGLIPSWAKDASIGNKLANARAETLAGKPAFRSAFRHRRCLIPASGFYEWKPVAGRKQPYYVRPADHGLFVFAGLYEVWLSPEGLLRTCTILTTDANALMQSIHNRMPVIVAPEDYRRWLDPGNTTGAGLGDVLAPYPAEHMLAYPVSTRVNNARNEDPALIERAAPAD
jgi:putative SOS response-associated peptidase YedK